MTVKRRKFAAAITLVEVMGAILVLLVAVMGASGYRYYAALDARKADTALTAARVALLLCESWRGVGGDETFDPISHFNPDSDDSGFAIETAAKGPPIPQGYTVLGVYKITVDGTYYCAAMTWEDTIPGLRTLNVFVFWDWDGSGGYSHHTRTSFRLTTYVAN